MSDRLEQVEVKLAYVEESTAQLSDVLFRQQQEIDALKRQIEGLKDRFEAAREAPTAYSLEEEKPPHY
jgi:SlyX protein